MNPDSYIVAGASAEKQMAEEQLLEDMVAAIKNCAALLRRLELLLCAGTT